MKFTEMDTLSNLSKNRCLRPYTNFDVKREKTLDFWKHLTPNIVPFNHPIFAPSKRELDYTVKDSGKNNIQVSSEGYNTFNVRNIVHYKNKHDNQVGKHKQVKFSIKKECYEKKTCYPQLPLKADNILLPKFISDNYFLYHLQDVSIVVQDIRHLNKDNVFHGIKGMSSYCCCKICRETKVVKKLCDPSMAVVHSTGRIPCSQNCVKPESMGRSDVKLCFTNSPFNASKKYSHAHVKLRRVEETVNFLNNLNLRPAWKNRNLFKSPVKIKRLGKLRTANRV